MGMGLRLGLGRLLILVFLGPYLQSSVTQWVLVVCFLSGELPLRFCSGNFALRRPSWSLPDSGGVQALLSEGGPDLSIAELPAVQGRVHSGGCWTKGAGGTWKRMRLTKKTAGSLVRRHGIPLVLHGVGWKRLRSHDEVLGFGARNDKRGRFSLHEHGFFPRKGVG